jgi:aminocarboxymuconate-semialdehyde decarboxylase
VKIDVHNHAFPDAVVDLLDKEDVFGLRIEKGVVTYSSRFAPTEEYEFDRALSDPQTKIANLERGGLEAAVISVDPDLFLYEVDLEAAEQLTSAANSGLADFCSRYPDRFRWMAHVPMQSPGRAAEILDDAVKAGAVGVSIGTAIADKRPDGAEFEPFWAAAERLGVPVFVHPAYNRPNDGLEGYHLQNVIGNPLETTIFIERMICTGMLSRHPSVRLILAHGGGFFPYQAGRLRHARTVRTELQDSPEDPWSCMRQVYIDTICHDRRSLAFLVSMVGPERVIMGTDHPFDMASATPMASLLGAVDEASARRIAEDNPALLFGFERSNSSE